MDETKSAKLIPANKKPDYLIRESEGEFYHLHVVEETPTADARKVLLSERTIIMSVRDFQTYLKFKQMFSWKEETLWHDPTLPKEAKKVEKVDEEKGVEPEPEQTEEPQTEPVKKGRFGRPVKN